MSASVDLNMTSEQLKTHSCSTCIPKFCAEAAKDTGASESTLKAHSHDGVVCPICMHTACKSMYFVRAAAVHTTSKKGPSRPMYGGPKEPITITIP